MFFEDENTSLYRFDGEGDDNGGAGAPMGDAPAGGASTPADAPAEGGDNNMSASALDGEEGEEKREPVPSGDGE